MGICVDRYVLLKVKNGFFDSYWDSPSSFNKLITSEDKVIELVGELSSSFKHNIKFSYSNIQAVFFDTLLGRDFREYRAREDLGEIRSRISDKDDIYLIIDTWLNESFSSISSVYNYISWVGIGFNKFLVSNLISNIQAINMGLLNDVNDLDMILRQPEGDHFRLYQSAVEYSLSKVGIIHV